MPLEQCENFPASYDTVTKIISGIAFALTFAVGVVIYNPIAAAILILVLVLSYAYSPRAYRVSEKAIVVKRLIGNVRVPLESLRAARRMEADDLRGCIRLWGSGGLFGYFGLFRTTKLGRCTWYATNRKNLTVVVGARKTTVYSPDDTEGFLRAIRAQVPIPESERVQTAIGTEREAASNPAAMWIALIIVIFATWGLVGVLLLVNRAHR